MSVDVAAWLKQAAGHISSLSTAPHLEAQLLLAHTLGKPREWLLTHPEFQLPPSAFQQANHDLTRLVAGEPLPYILQKQEFFGLEFKVNPAVLIPRPETELLLEHALAWLQKHPTCHRVADVGTGSGCIAVSLAVNAPGIHLLATDISFPALQVARYNAGFHRMEDRIQWVQADLLSPISTSFDLICANLPYIPTDTLPGLSVSAHEPLNALDGGPDGLTFIRSLLYQARSRIQSGGLLLLEIEASQGNSASLAAQAVFPQAEIRVVDDLAGHPRLLEIQEKEW